MAAIDRFEVQWDSVGIKIEVHENSQLGAYFRLPDAVCDLVIHLPWLGTVVVWDVLRKDIDLTRNSIGFDYDLYYALRTAAFRHRAAFLAALEVGDG